MKAGFSSWALVLSLCTQSKVLGICGDVFTHSTAVGACGGLAWRRGELLLSSATRENVRSNAVCQSAAIRALSDWKMALVICDRMPLLGIQQDQISVNQAVASCGQAKWLQAQRLVSQVVIHDRQTHNALAYACSKAAEWEQSQACLADARSKTMRLDSYSATALLTRSAWRTPAHHWQSGFLAYSYLVRQGVRSNQISWSAAVGFTKRAGWRHALNHLLQGYHSHQEMDKVVELAAMASMETRWQQAFQLSWSRRITSEMSSCLLRASSQFAWTQALLIYSALLHFGSEMSQVLCNSLIASSSPGSWQMRLRLLELMRRVTSSADHHTYASVAMGAAAGEWREAMEVLEHAAARGLLANPVMISALQVACLKGLNWKRPLAMLSYSQAAGNAVVCATAIGACGKCDQWAQQINVLSSWSSARLPPDERLHLDAGCWHKRSWRQALDTAKGISRRYLAREEYGINPVCAACAASTNWQLMIFLAQPHPGFVRACVPQSHAIQNSCIVLGLLENASRDSVISLEADVARCEKKR